MAAISENGNLDNAPDQEVAEKLLEKHASTYLILIDTS